MADRPDTFQDRFDVTIGADIRPLADAFAELSKLSNSFGSQLTGALRAATVGGKDLQDVLRGVASNLAGMALQQGLQPLRSLAGSLFSNLLGGLARVTPFAKGGVPGHVVPFAAGGVVSSPSYFPMGGNVGLMGEAGSEAILPLQRAADGRLGVAASGGGGGVSVVFNVTTADAASFRKSEAQVTGMLARAVSRGSRTM